MQLAFSLLIVLFVGLMPLSAHGLPAEPATVENDVQSLEIRLFQHNYQLDTIDNRLSRLEKMVFGESRTGNDQHRATELRSAVCTDITETSPAVASVATSQAVAVAGGGAPVAALDSKSSRTVQRCANRKAPVGTSCRSHGARQESISGDGDADDDSITDASQYPHITALEHELLGQTCVNQPVAKRLAALETKAFGMPSTCEDLSERTDRLEHYVDSRLHKTPFAVNPEMEIADSDGSFSYPRQGAVPVSYSHPAAPAQPRFMPPPYSSSPMLEKVTWMEGQVFGQLYQSDHLLDRLRRLDRTLFPDERAPADMKLMDEVDSLVSAVEVVQRQKQQSSAPVSIASNESPPAATSAVAQELSSPEEAPSDAASSEKHPFIKELAHCLGAAGNMALGMTGTEIDSPADMLAASPGNWY